ncbi:hypothetical protein HO173_004441 [Letharia columbiana]|uniref:Uncharacterized protein n=1 Tax=Letharia columbiana TaxID=112416 RepID=A0A8H6FZ70_9LECA|nr:uncharacterized protein HO173_004441 [Letharia columbiana]KAF6237551.1 hypothetical protein HO173_004441 [Letharia columbiana]
MRLNRSEFAGLDERHADLERTDKADTASRKLQIKNTRDTKGHEGERKRFAEEMLLNEQVEKLNFVLKSGKEKAESGKIRVEGRASR